MTAQNALDYVQPGPSEGCAALFAPSQSRKICGRCKAPRYCSRECQATHWTQHKGECRAPFVPPPLPEALAGSAWYIMLATSQHTVQFGPLSQNAHTARLSNHTPPLPGRYCLPRLRMPCNSRGVGSICDDDVADDIYHVLHAGPSGTAVEEWRRHHLVGSLPEVGPGSYCLRCSSSSSTCVYLEY